MISDNGKSIFIHGPFQFKAMFWNVTETDVLWSVQVSLVFSGNCLFDLAKPDLWERFQCRQTFARFSCQPTLPFKSPTCGITVVVSIMLFSMAAAGPLLPFANWVRYGKALRIFATNLGTAQMWRSKTREKFWTLWCFVKLSKHV